MSIDGNNSPAPPNLINKNIRFEESKSNVFMRVCDVTATHFKKFVD